MWHGIYSSAMARLVVIDMDDDFDICDGCNEEYPESALHHHGILLLCDDCYEEEFDGRAAE